MEVMGAIRGRVEALSRVVEPCAPEYRGPYRPAQKRVPQGQLSVRQQFLRRNRRCSPVLMQQCSCFPLPAMDSRPLQLFSRTSGKAERPPGNTQT